MSSCSRPTLPCSRPSRLRPKLLPVLSQTAQRQQSSQQLALRVHQARRRLISQRALLGPRALTARVMPVSLPNDMSHTPVTGSMHVALIAFTDYYDISFIASALRGGAEGLGGQACSAGCQNLRLVGHLFRSFRQLNSGAVMFTAGESLLTAPHVRDSEEPLRLQ